MVSIVVLSSVLFRIGTKLVKGLVSGVESWKKTVLWFVIDSGLRLLELHWSSVQRGVGCSSLAKDCYSCLVAVVCAFAAVPVCRNEESIV
ncbi:hypothetical protein Droror1_Dr00027219 [Drosera rotundifolia]